MSSDATILDAYIAAAPSAQTAVDVFAGEWASAFPAPLGDVRAGSIPLFEDGRISWAVEQLGGVAGARVLELGPLEGGHTYMLDRAGAAEVVAVEANTRAFLKCLIAKELLGMPAARFRCGDLIAYLQEHLRAGAPRFDVCVASGVLYHMTDPMLMLDLVTAACDRLFLWTMYYDEERTRSDPALAAKFSAAEPAEYAGLRYDRFRYEYREALQFKGFCGGSAAGSVWLSQADIRAALDHFGFDIRAEGFDSDNGLGRNFALVAARRERG